MSKADNLIAAPIPQEIPAAKPDAASVGAELLEAKRNVVICQQVWLKTSADATKAKAEYDAAVQVEDRLEKKYRAALLANQQSTIES